MDQPTFFEPPLISVIIPVYRAEKILTELYRRLVLSIETITPNFEILMVEDCGPDNSWQVIENLARLDARVRGIQFSRNFGQHYGITAGMDHATGDWVVVMDCDLQDEPEEIPKLYAKALEGFDVVLALRDERQDSWFKRVTSSLFYQIFSYLADVEYDKRCGNFRIMSRIVVRNFCLMREQLRFFGGHVQWMGFPAASVVVKHEARFEGASTYTFYKLLRLAVHTIIAYSDKPLRLATGLGFIMSAVSFGFGSYILCASFIHRSPIAGWSSLIVSIYFVGGLIIGILGIIGIYLGKTFDETKKRPLYIIRRQTTDSSGRDMSTSSVSRSY